MNWSFIVLGVTMMAGSVFIFRDLARGRAAAAGLAGMTAAGLGTVMVGLFPENSDPALHGAGAAIPFVLGNCSLFILAFALEMPVPLRAYAFFSGSVAILGLAAFASSHYLGLGEGGMERVVAYPQTIFLAVIGCYLIAKNPPGRGRRRAEVPAITLRRGGLCAAALILVRDAAQEFDIRDGNSLPAGADEATAAPVGQRAGHRCP
jgi:hypothetical membrane protein